MNTPFEQQLKNDAKAIQAQAAARLSEHDFSQHMAAQLDQQPTQTRQRSWWYATAAAVVLSMGLLLNHDQSQITPAPEVLTEERFDLQLEQYPIAIEHSINQPLLKEQQAIIDDLKALREQLLSI